jgi:hypothetical protein
MKKKWIASAISGNEGKLHSQLEISKSQKIPKTLLQSIVKAKAGETVHNPTAIGKKRIRVTRLLEQRSQFALNVGYKNKK